MSETGSMRSGTTGQMSETSSQRSDSRMLRKHKRSGEENDEGDLLEQKRSVQDGVFMCMYTLVRQSALSSWKFAVVKVILEGLMPFVVVFNPSAAWAIDTSNPVWQVVRWSVWRSPIMRLYGYDTYIVVLYVMAAAVLLAVAGLVWLTMAMRKQEQSKWLRTVSAALHIVYELIFMITYVSFLDYFAFAANCQFSEPDKEHAYFTGVKCLEMPHILHMSVAVIAAVVHFCVTALMVIASCDLNPVSQGYLASPDAYSRLKILAAKAVFIVIADDMQTWPKPQAVIMVFAIAFICWWNFRKLPFYRLPINVVWCSMWFSVLYTAVLLTVLVFGDLTLARREEYTMYVLYGIFPVLVGGMAIGAVHAWWALLPARKFQELTSFRNIKLQKTHKFAHQHEVEVLSRVMRKFDRDGVVLEDAAAQGEAVIKAGMQAFPNTPFLYILYANFLLEVRRDGPASRTQLQLALKHSPTLVERYQVYCTMEASKRLKDSQDGGMDLQAYIEFRRNFKAVLRVHKEVLLLELELWRMCLRSTLRVAILDDMLDELEVATARANQVYRRVLERYPTNGKLLRCYGKFLEDVKHDAVAAARVYGEAVRNGGADAIMSLDLSAIQQAANKPEFLTSLSLIDDAVVVINAEGTIMMVSQAVQSVFGYAKAELEGANVAVLMPQPFSQRHPSYMTRYIATGEAHILDNVREVVALHKDRYVFPLLLCVTKMSGSGTDSVFLGVLRPLPPSSLRIRAWLAPNGTFLCGDQQFASLCGTSEKDLVGRSLTSMVANPDSEVAALLERFREAPAAQLESGVMRVELLLRHRYLDPVPVEATIGLAGTDGQRIMSLSCRRTDGQEGNILVVDNHMRLRFASLGVAAMLSYPMRKLATMRLDQLLPPPYNTLHNKWLRDPPHATPQCSCRAGKVVHLLNDAGTPVPVRLKIHSATGDDIGLALYVVQVEKVSAEELFEEKRVVLWADMAGRVLAVSRPMATVFGFPAMDLLGTSLCDCIDVFGDWRKRNGDSQLQLLMLALIDKEQEMPGTSWRVRVQSPKASAELDPSVPVITAALPSMRRKTGTASASACLQVELAADGADDELEAAEGQEFGSRNGSAAGGGSSGSDSVVDVRIKLTLWRRDLLTGVVELDEQLVVRKASQLTGLIVGLPSTFMLKKPIQRFLDLPRGKTWEAIAAAHSHKRSSLKTSADRGLVSPPMAFIGPHPDSGTMRIVVQGVQTLAPGGRRKVTAVLHPDTSYVGAHADLLRVLHLEAVAAGAGGGGKSAVSRAATYNSHRPGNKDDDDDDDSSGDPLGLGRPGGGKTAASRDQVQGQLQGQGQGQEAGGGGRQVRLSGDEDREQEGDGGDLGDSSSGGSGDGGDNDGGDGGDEGQEEGAAPDDGRSSPSARAGAQEEDLEARGQAMLLRRASSKSDFVAQWVRTVSKRMSLQRAETPPPPVQQAAKAPLPPEEAPLALPEAPPPPRPSTPPKAAPAAAASPAAAIHRNSAVVKSGRLATIPEGLNGLRSGGGDGEGADGDSGDGGGGNRRPVAAAAAEAEAAGDKWEKASDGGDSSASGSQAASGITSITDGQSGIEVMVDARRGKLLKSLRKVLMGPMLMTPLERLRLHTYLLLAVMFITHIACYVIVTRVIAREHTGVYQVHRQAMAMDRAELLVVRILIGTYCQRPNITDKSSACTPPLSVHLNNMKASIKTLEENHQGVYLGFSSSSVTAPDKNVYDIWTKPKWDYHVYLDTQPPQVVTEMAGVWQLGNRFIAASREALYWMPEKRENFKLHRVYQFMVTNGLGSLFTGYATSLDLLMDAAWRSLGSLATTLLVLLIVEVGVVQVSCLCYQWLLIYRVERARLLGIFCMVALPAPVLRQLANRDVKVLDESDDESDDDDSVKDGDNNNNNTSNNNNDANAGSNGNGKNQKEAGGRGGASGDGDGDGGGGGGGRRRVSHRAEDSAGSSGSQPQGGKGLMDPAVEGSAAAVDGGAAKAGAGGALALLGDPDTSRVSDTDDGSSWDGRGGLRKDEMAAAAGLTAKKSGAPRFGGPAYEEGGPGKRASGSGGGAPQRAGRWRWRWQYGIQVVNGKALIPSVWRVVRFMLLPCLWVAGVIAVYAVSLSMLGGMQGPLASLNMASHVIYRYTRVRAVGFAFLSQDDAASRAVWRDLLANEVRLFRSEYDALMYGGTAISQVNSVFTHAVPPSTFASAAFANEFFRTKRCFRYNQSLCAAPGSPYYEVTRNGLDVMVRRMIMEMELLISDADEDVSYNTSRWTFMYNVGTFDLYEGLQQAAQLFVDYSISRYNEVNTLHSILLGASFAVFIVFIVFVQWPHLAKYQVDAARQSALLSHVPAEVDTVGHVKLTCRSARSGRKTGNANSNVQSGALVAVV